MHDPVWGTAAVTRGLIDGNKRNSPGVLSILGPAAIVAATAVLLTLMPSELRVVLTVWTLASFPIGVLFGHCVLSED